MVPGPLSVLLSPMWVRSPWMCAPLWGPVHQVRPAEVWGVCRVRGPAAGVPPGEGGGVQVSAATRHYATMSNPSLAAWVGCDVTGGLTWNPDVCVLCVPDQGGCSEGASCTALEAGCCRRSPPPHSPIIRPPALRCCCMRLWDYSHVHGHGHRHSGICTPCPWAGTSTRCGNAVLSAACACVRSMLFAACANVRSVLSVACASVRSMLSVACASVRSMGAVSFKLPSRLLAFVPPPPPSPSLPLSPSPSLPLSPPPSLPFPPPPCHPCTCCWVCTC